MGDLDFGTIFEQAAKEAELQKIITTYRNKIDFKAFSAVAKAAFEAIVEKKPAEEVNERCMQVIKDYIVPRGKMTLPEYFSLLESVGNVFLKYMQKKNEYAKFGQSNKSSQAPTTNFEQLKGKEIKNNYPKKSNKRIIKIVTVILIALIWWLIVFIKNPSNLGPGITLGHILQAGIIFSIAIIIIRKIWKNSNKINI